MAHAGIPTATVEIADEKIELAFTNGALKRLQARIEGVDDMDFTKGEVVVEHAPTVIWCLMRSSDDRERWGPEDLDDLLPIGGGEITREAFTVIANGLPDSVKDADSDKGKAAPKAKAKKKSKKKSGS